MQNINLDINFVQMSTVRKCGILKSTSKVILKSESDIIKCTACPLLSACVVIRLSHRLHKGCNSFWSLSREKTGGERGEEGREHCEAI